MTDIAVTKDDTPDNQLFILTGVFDQMINTTKHAKQLILLYEYIGINTPMLLLVTSGILIRKTL